jgi:hypothetical protein
VQEDKTYLDSYNRYSHPNLNSAISVLIYLNQVIPKKTPLGSGVERDQGFPKQLGSGVERAQGFREQLGSGVEREKLQVCQTEIAELVSKQAVS